MREMPARTCTSEKPLTYTIDEGKAIIRAARLNDRVFQVGMQQRSGVHYMKAKAEYFDSGKLGKITLARTWWHGNGYHLRKAPFKDKPAGLDWKKFQGPRPWRDWDVQQFWNWRAYLDFGGGQITDLFTHWIDVVQWFMKEDLPKAAVASGGVYPVQGWAHLPQIPFTCYSNIRANGRRRLKPRWLREFAGPGSNSLGHRAGWRLREAATRSHLLKATGKGAGRQGRRDDGRPCPQLPRLRQEPQTSKW
jgi:hypothetical protein